MLHNVYKTESQEIKRDVHEIWSAVRHQSDNVVPNYLRLHVLSNVFLDLSHLVSFFHIDSLAFSDKVLWKLVSHSVFEFNENFEELLSQDSKVFLFKKLGIDLRKRVKLGVHLILRY